MYNFGNYAWLFRQSSYYNPYAGISRAIMVVATLIICLTTIIGEWNIFRKAGEKEWYSLIPVYNGYVLYRIVWEKGWLVFLLFVPILNIVMIVLTQLKLAKAFGHSDTFAIGLILLPVVFIPVLGLDSSRYYGPRPYLRNEEGNFQI